MNDGIPLTYQPVQRGTSDRMLDIFSIEVEGQRACNYEPLSEAVHWSGVAVGVIADGLNPFPYDPQTISSIGDVGNVKVRQ